MVDVLLTHSYHLFYDRKQGRKMQPYPPLGTLYAAALLRQQGFSVALFDTMLEDPEQGFAAALARYRPQIVAVYDDSFNFLSKMCLSRMRQIAFGMIEIARTLGAKVVVSGSDASDHVEDYLERGAEAVLLGEAEWTLCEYVNSVIARSPRNLHEISGLAFRDQMGRALRTAPRPLMRDLDALPFPARDLIDIDQYRDAWKKAHGFFSLNLVSSRGCPYRCNWCAKPIYGDSYHVRSAESVAQEMKDLKEACGADHLWFADDLFAIKSQWAQQLAASVASRSAAVPFKMQSRADLMKRGTVAALREAGCAEVWMGVESGSQKILDAMDKGIRIGQVLQAREEMRRNGIRACFFLQFGYPGETWADIQKTVQLIREARPDDIGVSVSYPLPGTKFYERVRKQMGAKTNWVDSEDLAIMFKGAYKTEFYRALHDALHSEVESWNSQNDWKFLLSVTPAAGEKKQKVATRDLWARVELLEKTCRNEDPTELPVLACSSGVCN